MARKQAYFLVMLQRWRETRNQIKMHSSIWENKRHILAIKTTLESRGVMASLYQKEKKDKIAKEIKRDYYQVPFTLKHKRISDTKSLAFRKTFWIACTKYFQKRLHDQSPFQKYFPLHHKNHIKAETSEFSLKLTTSWQYSSNQISHNIDQILIRLLS